MVIHLREVEQDSYFIGSKISIPVTDILSVVQAPPWLLRRTENSTLLPLTSSVRIIFVIQLLNHYVLQEYDQFTASHPLKSIAGQIPVIVVPIILYSDDTSGNKSKRWNKFDSWCLKLAGLPNEENQKFSNIFHISSSNKVYIKTIATSRKCVKSKHTGQLHRISCTNGGGACDVRREMNCCI